MVYCAGRRSLTKDEMKQYRGRKPTVFKMAKELSTLCNVDVLLILYGPDKPNVPHVWCSKPDYRTVIDRYYGKNMDYGVQGGFKVGGGGNFIGKLANLNEGLARKIDYVEQRINNLKKVGPTSSSSSNFMNDDYFDGLNLADLCDLGQLSNNNNMIKVDQGYICNSGRHDCMGEVVDGNYGNSENLMNYGGSYCHGDVGVNNYNKVNYFDNVEVKVNNKLQLGSSFNCYNNNKGNDQLQVGPSFDDIGCVENVQMCSSSQHVGDNVEFKGNNQVRRVFTFDELGCVVNNQMSSSVQHIDDSKQKKNCSKNDLSFNFEDKVDGFEFSNQIWPSSSNKCDDTELMVDISDIDNISFSVDDLELITQFRD